MITSVLPLYFLFMNFKLVYIVLNIKVASLKFVTFYLIEPKY